MGTTTVTLSDVGQALVALDQEFHRLCAETANCRAQAALWHRRESALIDRQHEVEAVIARLLRGDRTYPLIRLGMGFRENED